MAYEFENILYGVINSSKNKNCPHVVLVREEIHFIIINCSVSGEYCQKILASLWGVLHSCFYDPITIFFPSVLVKGLSGSH